MFSTLRGRQAWTPEYLRREIPPLIELFERLAMRERDGIVRNSDAMLSPDELFPEGGEPSAVRLARCGWRFTGWHIESVLNGTHDADFPDDPDLRLAFCKGFPFVDPTLDPRKPIGETVQ